jgi:hypothetical protein
MPQAKLVYTYTFDELNESAKENARQWYREAFASDEWWDFIAIATWGKLIGIDIENVYFSGFASQGDGACFTGHYEYAKGATKAIRDYAGTDEALHAIADGLQAIQRRNFYQLSASVSHRGHYSHENCTDIDVSDCRTGNDTDSDTEETVKDLLRDFMRWAYRQLESEYDYLNSDESVDESILCNGYRFTESGHID